ncbi:MAG: DUF362 domain-containing protein [Deltaproteobacteria bacterium]|nr:DUF362 domain-containing protein [Deltaproteobacteria bacterium]
MTERQAGAISRRDLIAGAGAIALTAVFEPRAAGAERVLSGGTTSDASAVTSSTRGRATVGVCREPGVLDSKGRVRPEAAKALVERAVVAATGAEDAVAACRSLFKPGDVVGLKVNCLAGRGLSTHRELVDAVTALLVAAGVSAERVVIWERSDRDLRRAGYTPRRAGAGPLVMGTNDDYDNEPIEAGSVGGCLSRILSRRLDAVINMPVLKDHDLAGISGALKSFYGAIHNPNKYHDNGCSPYIADLYAHPGIRDKVRLTIVDALTAQYHGGPAWVAENTWTYGGVIASRDPVAVDATALEILAAKRQALGLPSFDAEKRAPSWLPHAAALGLGVADLTRIDRVTL